MGKNTTNVILCGIGGQGVILASEILAEAAFIEGWDVKKSEIRGLSQLGGSVNSSVRWGRKVYSPIIPAYQTDFLLALMTDEMANPTPEQNTNACIIKGTENEYDKLPNIKCANTYMLGKLSSYLDFNEASWQQAMTKQLKPHLIEINLTAFLLGKEVTKAVPKPQLNHTNLLKAFLLGKEVTKAVPKPQLNHTNLNNL
jgi:indolepyruvate ferredoxin oxidoreductase beta subunit